MDRLLIPKLRLLSSGGPFSALEESRQGLGCTKIAGVIVSFMFNFLPNIIPKYGIDFGSGLWVGCG